MSKLPTSSKSSDDSEDIIVLPEPHRIAPTECRICYRPAHGHHCGVASCKACKTFFRRICISDLKVVCRWEEKCFENKDQLRLRCQSCRYSKCIEIGMNPRFLELNDEEKESENFKKLVKRSTEIDDKATEKLKILVTIQSKEVLRKNKIDMLVYLDMKLEKFRLSSYNPFWMEFGNLEDMIKHDTRIGIADRCGPMEGWPFQKNQLEIVSLPEKSNIRALPDDPTILCAPMPPGLKIWLFFNIITTLEYAKTFEFYNKLKLDDKRILTRHVLVMCMNLHDAYFAVSRKSGDCLQPDGSVQPLSDERHYPVSQIPFAALIRCEIQSTEYILLKAICLCNPIVPGLSNSAQDIIASERQIYADLLLNHCLKTGNDGPGRFVELLSILPVLEQQQRRQKDDYIYFLSPLVEKLNIFSQFLHDLYYN